jgi:hypothetical protein
MCPPGEVYYRSNATQRVSKSVRIAQLAGKYSRDTGERLRGVSPDQSMDIRSGGCERGTQVTAKKPGGARHKNRLAIKAI